MDPFMFLAFSFFAAMLVGGLALNMAIYVVSQVLECLWELAQDLGGKLSE